MTTVDSGRFKLIYRSKNHHYLWREQCRGEVGPGSLVISDHSADDMSDRPTSVVATDDGVLYIDVDRILERGGLTIYKYEHNGDMSLWVPLFKIVNNERICSSTITGLPSALALLRQPEFQGCLEGCGFVIDLGDGEAYSLSSITVPCSKDATLV